jgi:hypothetical protein
MAKKASKTESGPKPRREPVYTIMVFVTFVAMVVGCVLMYLDHDEYGKQSPPKENPPTLPKLGDQPKANPNS